MKDEYSEYSMLRSGLPRNQLSISSIVGTTERNIRAMCRAMQVYEQYACGSILNLEKDFDDLTAVFSAFYGYVDGQMDVLSELSSALESGLRRNSLENLKDSEDFGLKPLPAHAFVSLSAYLAYCEEHGFAPETGVRSPFNDALGDQVAPADDGKQEG